MNVLMLSSPSVTAQLTVLNSRSQKPLKCGAEGLRASFKSCWQWRRGGRCGEDNEKGEGRRGR
jgi:hypothetical protein